MALIESGGILLYFLIICFTTNNVHAAPPRYPSYMNDDYKKCLRQLKIAFKSDTSTGCFSYALKHYKKGEHISVDENLISNISGQSQNIASTSGQINNIANISGQSQNIASTSGQINNIANTSNQSFVGQTNVEQDDTSLEDLSDFIGTFEGLEDFIRNDQSFVGQMHGGKDDVNLEDLSKYVDSFEGLQDFIKNDPQNSFQHFDGQSSGYEDNKINVDHISDPIYSVGLEPTYYVDNYQNPIFYSQTEPTSYVDNYQNPIFYSQTEEHQYAPNEHQYHPPNYATFYYMELEKMVQGRNVIPPLTYCDNNFPNDPNCYYAMSIFGKPDYKSSKMAVGIALTDLKLDGCGNSYVYNYMKYMIKNIQIIYPSKAPKTFCLEILKNEEWYLILKSYNV